MQNGSECPGAGCRFSPRHQHDVPAGALAPALERGRKEVSEMRLWGFLIVRQIKKGAWISLLMLLWPVAGFVLGLPLLMWVPHLGLIPGLIWLGALLDKPFYEKQMPALWRHLPADDATLDRIITNHEMRQMNAEMGEDYWPEERS